MAAEVEDEEPSVITAGDSITWSKFYPEYPADVWTLQYWAKPVTGTGFQFAAIANGLDFLVTKDKTSSASLTPGDYLLVGFVSTATERHLVYSGKLTVLPNLGSTAAYDGRSWAAKTLADVEAMLLGTMARSEISYSINGRSFTLRSTKDLLEARDYLRAEVAAESFGGRNRKILTRFVNAR